MNESSSRLWVGAAFLFLFASVTVAQNGQEGMEQQGGLEETGGDENADLPDCAPNCTLVECQALDCDRAEAARQACSRLPGFQTFAVCNRNLAGVFEFVETTYTDAGTCEVLEAGTTASRLCVPNLAVANILSRLDIDGDGVPDAAPDTDGDGLPDNWELGGVETSEVLDDRVVFFPEPSAIIPGTPPTPIFTRRAVATSALQADTDDDGLSDFIEVFGLMFIDDNGNGILDASDWQDFNGDGLPSPGEYPVDGSGRDTFTFGPDNIPTLLLHDFDGFVFTNPSNPDTDGDGRLDGPRAGDPDPEPLINLRAFGITSRISVRFGAEGNDDFDLDGLGNAMDMGNDALPDEATGLIEGQVIDNPANLRELLSLFREDLLAEGIVPESAIEDLLGADWDGNGLWRTTDVREWSLVIDPDDESTRPPDEFFLLDPNDPSTALYSPQKLNDEDLTEAEIAAGRRSLTAVFNDPNFDRYGGRGIGLGWQKVLQPPTTTNFIPDVRVWAILYSWRMPGFDIDGDGFVGVPNLSATASTPADDVFAERARVALREDPGSGRLLLTDEVELLSRKDTEFPFDDRIVVGTASQETVDPRLNGVVEVPQLSRFISSCGAFGGIMPIGLVMALMVPLWWRRK